MSPVSGAVTVTASVSPTIGLTGVQFKLDDYVLEARVTVAPYQITWSAASAANGSHRITAEAQYGDGSVVVSAPLALTVANPETFNRLLYVDATGGNDANDGLSVTSAWRTLAQANASVQPGDTVYLKGTFSSQSIQPAVSGTAAKPIRFTSSSGQTAVIDVGDSNGTTVWLPGAYVIVDGLTITNGTYFSVYLDGGNHNVIRNSTLNATAIYVTGSDNLIERNTMTDFGSEVANTGDSLVLVNGASRNRILYNTVRNAGHALIGIGHQGAAAAADNVVAHNVLSNPWANVLALLGQTRRTVVEYNQLSDGASNGVNYPRAGINLASPGNVIRYNTMLNNAGPGIMVYSQNVGGLLQEAIGNQVYHNVLYGNGQEGLLIQEEDGLAVQNNLIANNIFFRNGGFPFGGNVYTIRIDQYNNPTAWPVGSLNGNVIENNIVLRQPGSAGEGSVIRVRNTSQGGNLDYTLGAFQATYAGARNNLEQDPLFVSESGDNFHLQAGSPAIDAGVVVAVDRLSIGVAPDIGAYEYSLTVLDSDTTPPTVGITAPTARATVAGTMTVAASAIDNVGVV
ncbi:MAG: hypothetical protein AUH29_14800, partial [Candidatus Rokubacteria bacterium 13_1_40CM_69_27]